mmetsp:Transcript_7974/g.15613  ORF Transcript_7974/g.15613 Transcript_7974/m.15613 type:complete len:189 (-) Transcript_7974:260-826(-)
MCMVLIEGFYKFEARKLIFMLNPCHIVGSWQAYLLMTEWKPWKAYAFIALIGWSSCPVVAMLFPAPGDTTIPYEMEVFWLEHIFCGLISPIVLVLSGRYRVRLDSWKNFFFGQGVFVLYQRVVLMNISIYYWVNMNFTLCPASTDPLIPYIGIYYYILSEAYLAFGSLCSASLLYGTLAFIAPKYKSS